MRWSSVRSAADWVHYWKSYLRSKLNVLGTNDEYLGEDRVDHRYQVGAGAVLPAQALGRIGGRISLRDPYLG